MGKDCGSSLLHECFFLPPTSNFRESDLNSIVFLQRLRSVFVPVSLLEVSILRKKLGVPIKKTKKTNQTETKNNNQGTELVHSPFQILSLESPIWCQIPSSGPSEFHVFVLFF